jgi:post-segregation antitoxin (ccd killing protein)
MACHLTYSTRYQLHCVKEALHRSEQRGRRSQLLDEIRTEARYRIYDDVEREVRANLGLNMSRRLKKAIHKRALELTETYRWKEKHFNDLHRQVEKCAQSLEKNIHTLRKQKIYLQSKLFEATGVAYTEPTSLRNAWDEEPEIEIDQTIRLIQEKLNEFVNSDSE